MSISFRICLGVLAAGAVDVTVSWGEAVAYDMSADRKAIARDSEKSVRHMTALALRAAPPARQASVAFAEMAKQEPARICEG